MAVDVKMGVDIGGFTTGIRQGQQMLKGLNAEMKASDAAFKATGNAEQKLASQTKNLNSQIEVQKKIADNARQALESMTKAGVDPADAAYQKMYITLMNAEAGANNARAALNELGEGASGAAENVDSLASGLNSISRKISLEQVIKGINSITGGLETAAKKAADLGKEIWNALMDSAQWSDDTATAAMLLDMNVEEYQRYKDVFDTIAEMTVADWMNAKRKVQKAIYDPSTDQLDVLSALGISTKAWGERKGASGPELIAKDWEDVFWEAARMLQGKVERGEITQDMADTWGEALFGKKFASMKPLMKLGEEGFKAALEEQTVASEEAINKNAELNDKIIELKGDFQQLQAEIMSGLAPALESAAGVLSSLLSSVMEYLQSPEGQKALSDLETAVSGLFEDLGKIDPEAVVSGFTDVFNTVVGSVQWLVEHWHEVVDAMTGIVVGWGALKLSGGALQILQLINGLKGLGGGSAAAGAAGSAAAGTAGNAAAGATGTGIVSKGLHIAPYAAPFVIAIDQLIHDQQVVSEAMQKGAESIREYQEKSGLYSGSEMFSIWDTLTKYTTANGSPEDRAAMKQFVEHYWRWWNDEVTDSALDEMAGAMSQEDFDKFHDIMGRMARGEQFYSNEDITDLSEAMAAAIKAAEQVMAENPLKIPSEADLPSNINEILVAEIGKLTLPAEIVITPGSFAGVGPINQELFAPHANGLQFVPYDGYLAMLHKGERVVPAREVSNRNYNSNLYIENMNMSGNADAQGLAAAIAAANRRTMAGYGD